MAIRIPWDEYETAILISACVDYNAGKCTKKEAIKYVSQTLRKRAEKNGIEIDAMLCHFIGQSLGEHQATALAGHVMHVARAIGRDGRFTQYIDTAPTFLFF